MINIFVKGGKYSYTQKGWFGINFLASANIEDDRGKHTSFRIYFVGAL